MRRSSPGPGVWWTWGQTPDLSLDQLLDLRQSALLFWSLSLHTLHHTHHKITHHKMRTTACSMSLVVKAGTQCPAESPPAKQMHPDLQPVVGPAPYVSSFSSSARLQDNQVTVAGCGVCLPFSNTQTILRDSQVTNYSSFCIGDGPCCLTPPSAEKELFLGSLHSSLKCTTLIQDFQRLLKL